MAIQSHPCLCDCINVGSLDIATVVTDVIPTEVIGHEEHDVGCGASQDGQRQQESESDVH